MRLLREQPSGSSVGPPFPGDQLIKSTIDAATLQAYLESEYRVQGGNPFVLRIGDFSHELAEALKQVGADCCAFVTAFNPFSQTLDDAANARRHAELARQLSGRGLACIEGLGQHPTNGWPGEVSYLIFGLPLDAAKDMGNRFGQNAIVWSGSAARPELILLR